MKATLVVLWALWVGKVSSFSLREGHVPRIVSPVSGTSPSRNFRFMATRANTGSRNMDHFRSYLEDKERMLRDKLVCTRDRMMHYESSLKHLRRLKKDVLTSDSHSMSSAAVAAFTETTARSVLKSLLWRIMAGSVTFITTLRFSGSMPAALQVVSADFVSKALTMFLGERIMNQSQAGRAGGSDDVKRSLAKALVWRLFAIANTLCMAIFVAKDLSVASKIASTDAVVKTTLMFWYERLWARVHWGKEYSPLTPQRSPSIATTVSHAQTRKRASVIAVAVARVKELAAAVFDYSSKSLPVALPAQGYIPAYATNVTAFGSGGGI